MVMSAAWRRIGVALAQAVPGVAWTVTPKLSQQLGHGPDIGQARAHWQGQGFAPSAATPPSA